MTSKRIAQFNQQHKRKASQESGTLQRAAVRSVSEAGVQSTDDLEAQPLGNSAFSKDFSRVPISTTKSQQIMAKLMIGEPGDKYEQEADETARQVVQKIHQPQSEKLQRESLPEKEDELQMKPMVQRVSDGGMPASPDLETSIQQARGSGQPLADSIKSPMEQAFGADFSRVRVHTDSQADQLNQSIQAKAFTTGQDVFFRQGAYEPGSRGGQQLIAHELTHVMQQNGAAVMRSPMTQEHNQQYSASDKSAQLEAIAYTQRTNLIQRKIIARIRTKETKEKKKEERTRLISEIRLEGRAPTDVPGSSQGDHTIAETLINESVKREILDQTPQVALNNILVLAKLTLPESNIEELNNKVGLVWSGFSNLQGEDQNAIVEDVIQRYIEMANKRPATAFLRQEEVTRGGGRERQHIGLVRDLANKLENQEKITDEDLLKTADGLSGLIDMKYVQGDEQRYIDLVIRALDHAVFSVLLKLGTMPENYRKTLIFSLMTKLQQRDDIPADMFKEYMFILSKKYIFNL